MELNKKSFAKQKNKKKKNKNNHNLIGICLAYKSSVTAQNISPTGLIVISCICTCGGVESAYTMPCEISSGFSRAATVCFILSGIISVSVAPGLML